MSRFSEPQDPVFRRLNTSLGFDQRLWPQDLAQSRAHARMLAAQAIIGEDDRDALLRALDAAEVELRAGTFPFDDDDEDIHMAIERRVTELAGRPGGTLHTARSRNDQVATDIALFTRDAARAAAAAARRARRGADRRRRAPPRLAAARLHAPAARAARLPLPPPAGLRLDAAARPRPAALRRVQTAALPLGAGALAGVNFDTDRAAVAAELGFGHVAPNSIDAVSNRDFVLDYLSAAATCATHLSRLGAELVLWSSEEFAFVTLPDAWTSGSSIMPQKKNPDAAELLRAKAPRIVAHLSALHGVMHGLPLTYNKDLQEDKEHLFDAVDTLELCLAAATGMIRGARFHGERMAAAASDDLIAATDLADLLVTRGVPFRECHGIVAGLVRVAVDSGRALSQLSDDELTAACEQLEPAAVREVLAQRSWLESKVSEGGTALARVREQLEAARTALAA